jgi:hypothetical protein
MPAYLRPYHPGKTVQGLKGKVLERGRKETFSVSTKNFKELE